MKTENIYEEVRRLIEKGYGRRKVARALDITEWAARHLIADVINKQTSYKGKAVCDKKEAADTPCPVRRKTHKTATKRKQSKSGTDVTIKTRGVKGDTPTKIEKRSASLKIAVLSDIHYPYEDAQCIKIVKSYLRDYKPDMIILNGDITDCYSVSRYEKNMKGRPDIQEEIDYTAEKLEEWVTEFPDTEFKFIEGNHEERLRRHVSSNAPALVALRNMSFPYLVGLDNLGIEWIGTDQELQIGSLLFTHGHMARKHAGTTARGHFESYGCSVIVGHVHRLSVAWKRNKIGHHAMVENGTLCDFDVEYLKFPDWQHGFTTIEFDGNDFCPRQHPIIDYKLIADGKVYVA